jgi:hypothetical protein
MSMKDLRTRCVELFPQSSTRQLLFLTLERLVAALGAKGLACEIWVDGSFVTEKPNPADIDLTVVFHGAELDRLARDDRDAAIDLLAMERDGRFRPDLHLFMAALRPAGHPDHAALTGMLDYWAQWWSVTRENWVKGFAVVKLGESDVAVRILP